MGFFAILAAVGTPDDKQPVVTRCHINLWSLPSLWPGRLLHYFDVGIEIRAVEDVASVQLLLPFRVEEGAWIAGNNVLQDLGATLESADTAELVFGGPVITHSTSQSGLELTVADYPVPLKVARINLALAKVATEVEPRKDSSLVDLPLQLPIHAGTSAYARVRLRVFGSAPLWLWNRRTGGAQVDFRMADVRESKFVDKERILRARILNVEQANVFVIAPSRFELVAQSPDLRYVRRLEPGAWRKYLAGTSYFGSGGRLLVYYWRHHKTSKDRQANLTTIPINADDPFRTLLTLRRASSRAWWVNVIQFAGGALLAYALIKGVNSTGFKNSVSGVHWTNVAVWLIGGTGVASILGFVKRLRTWVIQRFRGPRLKLRELERYILKFRAD